MDWVMIGVGCLGGFFQPAFLGPVNLHACCTLPFMRVSLKHRAIAHKWHVLKWLGQVRVMISFKARKELVGVALALSPLYHWR